MINVKNRSLMQTGGIGLYSQIVSITAPSSAAAGDMVSVVVRVKNIYSLPVTLACVGVLDTEDRFIDWPEATISPGAIHDFEGSFTMPNRDATINIYTYYYNNSFYSPDAYLSKAITVTAAGGWNNLDSRDISITTGTTPTTDWNNLDSRDISIESGFTPPVDYQLVMSETYPAGKNYSGPAQRWYATFKFLPANWPGVNWFITKGINAELAKQITSQGLKPLTMRLYEKGFDYYLILEATNPAAARYAPAVPSLPAAAIVPLIIASATILGLIIIAVVVFKTEDFIYKAPGAAFSSGLVVLGIAGVAVLGLAIANKTSLKESISGRR